MQPLTIRPVRPADAHAIAAIYAPIVEHTIISFEEVPPTQAQMRERIDRVTSRFPWLVAEREAEVLGYVYASPHHERAGYRWSVDVSAYVHAHARRQGVASSLYRALFALLEAQRFHCAFAGITLPNDASVRLHQSAGFELIGVYREVGYKLGAWRDTSWWRRPIGAAQPPADPIVIDRLGESLIDETCMAAAASRIH
jgi:L-amino acid N-acyltransferase YncA